MRKQLIIGMICFSAGWLDVLTASRWHTSQHTAPCVEPASPLKVTIVDSGGARLKVTSTITEK